MAGNLGKSESGGFWEIQDVKWIVSVVRGFGQLPHDSGKGSFQDGH